MFSQTNEYALRIMVHLAGSPSALRTTPQIAAVTQIPVGYLAKVLQTLTKAGFITGQRGLHGGFALACDPAITPIFNIIDAVDPLRRIHTCPLELSAHCNGNLCTLHRKMDNIFAQVERSLREMTLADLLADNVGARPFDLPADENRLQLSASIP